MRLWQHCLAAAPLTAGLYLASGGAAPALAGGALSVLLDLDHLADYLCFRRRWLGIRDFFTVAHQTLWPRLVLALHSWELLAVAGVGLGLALGPAWAGCLVAGWAWHLAFDQLGNPVRPLFYFLAYRASRGFARDRLLKPGFRPGPRS